MIGSRFFIYHIVVHNSLGRFCKYLISNDKDENEQKHGNQSPLEVFGGAAERDGSGELERLDVVDFGVNGGGNQFEALVVALFGHHL